MYPAYQLPDFRLGARPHASGRVVVHRGLDEEQKKTEPEAHANEQHPVLESILQQLMGKVDIILESQQQLQSQVKTF